MHFRNLVRLRDFIFCPSLNYSSRGLPRYMCNLVFFTYIEDKLANNKVAI